MAMLDGGESMATTATATNGQRERLADAARKRLPEPEEGLPCVHLQRAGGRWLQGRLDEVLGSASAAADVDRSHVRRLGEYLDGDGVGGSSGSEGPRGLRSERYTCLSCDFVGPREPAVDDERPVAALPVCFMTHAILTDHTFALLERRRRLYCASCRDFVYPEALTARVQVATPCHRTRGDLPNGLDMDTAVPAGRALLGGKRRGRFSRRRRPALRRRLLRSSARRGLVNMGNTCYMNAVLQALAHNPLIQHEYFVLRSHSATICEQRRRQMAALVDERGAGTTAETKDQSPKQSSEAVPTGATASTSAPPPPAVCLGCELSGLLQTLFPAPRSTLTRHHLTSPVVPQALLEAFWTFDRDFVGSGQQDAHEFLVALLNGIHRHTHTPVRADDGGGSTSTSHNNNNSTPTATTAARNAMASPRFTATGRSLCDCVVHHNFAGTFRSEVQCAFCTNVSGTNDPFLDLSLSIDGVPLPDPDEHEDGEDADDGGPPRRSLAALLRHFTAEERLKGKNQVFCLPCRRYVDATRRIVLERLPNLLVVHLKRLDFHKKRKISDRVSFPIQGLDLGEFCAGAPDNGGDDGGNGNGNGNGDDAAPPRPPRDAMYDLAAVVTHHGDTIDGGHFTAFVHAPSADGDARPPSSQWLLFDDCEVRAVSPEDVRGSQAYMLFYVRRRVFA